MKKIFIAALLFAAVGTANAANTQVTVQVNTVNVVNDGIDATIASYEKFVNKYIACVKKVKGGDMTAAVELAKLAKQAEDIQKKLEKQADEMTEAQAAKLVKLSEKMLKAAQEMM